MHKKLILLLCILASSVTFSQVVTNKKAAEKKGIYQKPTTETSSTSSDKKLKAAPKTLANKNVKSIVNEKGGEDIETTSITENYLAVQIINNAMQFMGVKYRTGGTSKAGMDCSGMVTAVFNIFDKAIPRSSNDMAKIGEKVEDTEVQKGDLIFFKTNGRSIINHVGLVIGKDEDGIQFIHSSTSKGVIVSSTKESYYKKAFAQVNRIL